MTRTSNVQAESVDALLGKWSRAVGRQAAAEAQAYAVTELLVDVAVAWQQYGPPPGPAAEMTALLGRLRHLLLTSPKWLPEVKS